MANDPLAIRLLTYDWSEAPRLQFLIARDGEEAARAWARRTADLYAECIDQDGRENRKFHFASREPYRARFYQAVLQLEHFACL